MTREGHYVGLTSDSSPGRLWSQLASSLIATLGGCLMGSAIGWSGPALPLLQNQTTTTNADDLNLVIDETAATWVAALMPFGAIFGGVVGGLSIRRLGRRSTMLCVCLLYTLSYLIIASALFLAMLIVGRVASGLACGMTAVAVPIYVAETVRPEIRGSLASLFQLMVTLGVAFAACIGALGSWRWLSVACLALSLVWAPALTLLPESPVYLVQNARLLEARQALLFLWGPNVDVEAELASLQLHIEHGLSSSSNGLQGLSLFARRRHLKPLIIALVLMAGQQLSGINGVLFFLVQIFEAAGTKMNSYVEAIIVSVVQAASTLLAALLVDRCGRRLLLLSSALVMAVSIYFLGYYFYMVEYLPERATHYGALPVVSLCVYIFSFAIGFGPVPWVMVGELFSPEAKSTAGSISAVWNWSLAFAVTLVFPWWSKTLGTYTSFWLFASVLVLTFVFVAFRVPETKGKTLREIERIFDSEQDRVPIVHHVDQDELEDQLRAREESDQLA